MRQKVGDALRDRLDAVREAAREPRAARVEGQGADVLARVLQHAIEEAGREKVSALVFIGDCMEEDPDHLGDLAGRLGLLGVPCFLFHEGHDPDAVSTFGHIAALTRGACLHFDGGSPAQLRQLLAAVAAYASGGVKALEARARREGGMARQLTDRLGGRR